MEQFAVLFRGAVIGTLHGQIVEDFCGGDFVPVAGFDAIRGTIADASRALANHGFLPPETGVTGGVSVEGSEASVIALAAAQELANHLELRDARGRLLHTDWINIFGGRTPDDPISVMATLRHAPSATPASIPERDIEDSGGDSPAG